MTVPARLGIVTLGVADVARSVAFYEALGWERCSASMEGIAWFRTADTPHRPVPVAQLAPMPAEPRARFGVTLAIQRGGARPSPRPSRQAAACSRLRSSTGAARRPQQGHP